MSKERQEVVREWPEKGCNAIRERAKKSRERRGGEQELAKEKQCL